MGKKLKKKVPELRFPEFQCDWEVSIIEKISTIVTSGSRSWAQYYSAEGAKFIRMTNLDRNNIKLLLDDLKYVSLPTYNSEGQRTALKYGDILISITAELGKIGIIPNDFGEAYINQHICLVRPDFNKINPLFFALKLSSQSSHKRLNRLNDSGAKSGLNLGSIKKFSINIPSIAEQEKIASFLGAIANRLTQLRRKQELLQTYKRGVMQKIFSQQIRFKQDDGSDFPDWQKKKLGELADFSKGKGISKDDLCNSGNLKCIRYAELYTSYNEVIKDAISSTNLSPKNLILSQKNDVIIPSSGETAIDMAKAACVNISGIALGGDLTILRTNINGIFLAYYLNHYKKIDIAKIAQGASVVHLYSSQLKLLSIEIPLLEEQQKIVDFLTTIDQKIEAVEQQIDRTEQFKKGLLQKMFI